MSMQEDRKKALQGALAETENLINMFERTVRRNWDLEIPRTDFSQTAQKILANLEPAQETKKEIKEEKPAPAGLGDIRLSLDLAGLKKDCASCNRCRLAQTRTNTVFGDGCEVRPDVLVVGEGPGETEDKTGLPFVGRAGELLTKMLAAISLNRENNCYITNTVKCRPPENRDPLPDEKQICGLYVRQQIALIRPKAILCLGKGASCMLTGEEESSMGQLRGRFFFYDNSIPLICTYHPAAVLRNPDLKRPVWEDLKKLARFLNLGIAGERK